MLKNRSLLQITKDMIRYTDDDGNTWFHLAAIFGIVETLPCLLEQLEDLDRENHQGFTPLQLTVAHGEITREKTDVARMLLEAGADANHVCHDPSLQGGADIPPLHFCLARDDKPQVVETLIKGGTDVNLRASGETPLSIAVARGQGESSKLLLAAGASLNDDDLLLYAAARTGLTEVARILLDKGAEVDRRDDDAATPAVLAVMFQEFGVLELLCSQGADPLVIEEFQFFKRMRDDGKIDRMYLHTGKNTDEVSAASLNEGLGDGDGDGRWEDWKPVKIEKKT